MLDAGPDASGSLELLRADRKLAYALARQHVDRVAHCRCDRWYTRLARATDEIARLQHVHLDRRRLVYTKHRVVIEVGLDDPSFVDSDRTVENGRKTVDDTPLRLGFNLARIGGKAGVDGAHHAMDSDLAVGRERDLGYLGGVAA